MGQNINNNNNNRIIISDDDIELLEKWDYFICKYTSTDIIKGFLVLL